jgi:excisionase family DNA binding protein
MFILAIRADSCRLLPGDGAVEQALAFFIVGSVLCKYDDSSVEQVNMRRRSKDVLAVEETAQVLGIGRQTAYAQCRLFLATDGREGIPCHRIGRRILIYRAELEAWLGFPVVWPPESQEPPAAAPPARPAPAPANSKRRSTKRRDRRVNVGQATLPF